MYEFMCCEHKKIWFSTRSSNYYLDVDTVVLWYYNMEAQHGTDDIKRNKVNVSFRFNLSGVETNTDNSLDQTTGPNNALRQTQKSPNIGSQNSICTNKFELKLHTASSSKYGLWLFILSINKIEWSHNSRYKLLQSKLNQWISSNFVILRCQMQIAVRTLY